MSPLESYANGMSARQVAKMHGIDHRTVRRMARNAGILRTRSEGMTLRYNPAMSLNKGGDLVLRIGDWAVIVSPYNPIQYFAGPK